MIEAIVEVIKDPVGTRVSFAEESDGFYLPVKPVPPVVFVTDNVWERMKIMGTVRASFSVDCGLYHLHSLRQHGGATNEDYCHKRDDNIKEPHLPTSRNKKWVLGCTMY